MSCNLRGSAELRQTDIANIMDWHNLEIAHMASWPHTV